MIDAAGTLDDLKAPPANRLEALKGDLKGFYSIRINDQYRIVFTFKNGNAHDVYRCLYITDYHNWGNNMNIFGMENGKIPPAQIQAGVGVRK